jgi:hypothetical protein
MPVRHGLDVFSCVHSTRCPDYFRPNNKNRQRRNALVVRRHNGDDAMANSAYFFPESVSPSGRARPHRSWRTLLRRALDAVVEARHHYAEREVARYIQSTGGKFTDTVEREIQDRLYPHASGRLF